MRRGGEKKGHVLNACDTLRFEKAPSSNVREAKGGKKQGGQLCQRDTALSWQEGTLLLSVFCFFYYYFEYYSAGQFICCCLPAAALSSSKKF